ncbi:hypothetical protein B9Z55_000699 [Caenorhabditis nigoni]|nr:hypothetical protein B9Z55_000699 [Caenorhabditis nigoni]
MEYSELFMLSFVSKNTKKFIKLSQKKRFKSISSIRYDHEKFGASLVYIPINWDIILEMVNCENWENLMEEIKDANGGYHNFQLNVTGKILRFQMCYSSGHPIVCVDNRDKESIMESIHSYFLDFFGNSMQYYWREKDYADYFFPKLPDVSFCIDLHLSRHFSELEKLETFFSASPVFKWIRLNAEMTWKRFNPESKFYQAESLELYQLRPNFPATLRHFKGRQAIFKCAEWENSQYLIEFVNRWKSGDAFQKMEYLKFKLLNGEFPENRILNEIGAKYIDETEQPPKHVVPKVYDWRHCFTESNTDPITSHAYVVRQPDNRVASILIEEKTFSFGVWDKTEEEFLKLMD